jgi:hypothetical protein
MNHNELTCYLFGVATSWASVAMAFLFGVVRDDRRQRRTTAGLLAADTLQEVRKARQTLLSAKASLESPAGGDQTDTSSSV